MIRNKTTPLIEGKVRSNVIPVFHYSIPLILDTPGEPYDVDQLGVLACKGPEIYSTMAMN